MERRGVAAAIVETDGLATYGMMSWSPSGEIDSATVSDVDSAALHLAELDVVWWRRLTGDPRLPDMLRDEAARDLVTRACRATLIGIGLTSFQGQWVSHPEATRLAENKVVQLQAAARVGLRLPRTLISQDPRVVRRFCEDLDYQVIVKTVAGTPKTPLMTGKLDPEHIASDASVSVCPAIYQELVPGTRHLRVCCFGDQIYTAVLKTETLDWRYPLDAEAAPYNLDSDTANRIIMLVKDLGLRMGIADLKLDPEGEPVWLELNPQGQFLFLQGMCRGMPLTEHFAEFLIREAEEGRAN